MTHANKHAAAADALRNEALQALDRTFFTLRRLIVKPPTATVPIAALGRTVDIAQIIACEAIDELSAELDCVTVKDVAQHLGLEPSTVSRLLTEMEAEGLVARGSHPADGRRTTLMLTADGKLAVAGSGEMRHTFLRHMTDDWEPTDLCRLGALLERFAKDVHSRKAKWDPSATEPGGS